MDLVNANFKLDSRIGLKIIKRDDVQLNSGFPSQAGAHGRVHQGLLDGMLVAVKTPLHCSLTEKNFKKFIEELSINASVRHPNCVVVLAACHDRADPMYVMEWMSGGSLFEMLGKDTTPPMHVRLRNAREIASAVEYLHQRLITHGDLKSLNIMLTSDLIAKVCDFGAAIQRLNSAMSLSSQSIQSTIQWSAPELLQGAPPNPATDIYALGVLFWELAFCDTPFQSMNQTILMSLIKDGLTPEIPTPLPPCAAAFPPGFFVIMQRCWAQDPQKRPTAHEIHRVLVSIDPSARPSAPLEHYPLNHPFPTASLLDCVRRAMPAAAEAMLLSMMRQADSMFRANTQDIQSTCARYGLLPIEANALTVSAAPLIRDHLCTSKHIHVVMLYSIFIL
jgi:serine/threonine protein kinase